MICSHYEVYAYDLNQNVLASVNVYSFDEAYYFVDKFREQYSNAVEFCIKYPTDEIAYKRCLQSQPKNDTSHPFADDVLMGGD